MASAQGPVGVDYLRYDLATPSEPWPHGQDGLHAPIDEWMWLKDVHVPGDVRVTAVVRMSHPDGLEICIDSRREPLSRDGWVPTGYSCQFAGYAGSVDLISRNAMARQADINNAVDSAVRPGTDQTVVIERRGERLALWIDGQLRASDDDPLPLTGASLDGIGLHTFCADLVIRSLKVERLALPEKASPLIVGDALVQAGDYADAITSYLATARDHPGGGTAELALTKAYFAAMRAPDHDPTLAASIRQSLDRSFPASRYQSRLLELDALHAWNRGDRQRARPPGLDLRRRSQRAHRGAPALGRASAPGEEPGAPASPGWARPPGARARSRPARPRLHRRARAARAAPAQPDGQPHQLARAAGGMPPANLDISRNLVQSLEPIAGLPLIQLVADDNLISSVAPLIRCPTLTTLDLHANAISTLAQLQGLPLTTLFAGLNPLVETPTPGRMAARAVARPLRPVGPAPLAHARLTTLQLGGNRIHDLGPLSGFAAAQAHDQPEPHRRPRSARGVHAAGYPRLRRQPGRGPRAARPAAPACALLRGQPHPRPQPAAGHAPRRHPLRRQPHHQPRAAAGHLPTHLLYDDGNFPLDAIARAEQRLRHDGHLLLARQAQALLAARHGDIKELLRLAHRARGRAYLMVPLDCSWEDATARAQALGGHLACIADVPSSLQRACCRRRIRRRVDRACASPAPTRAGRTARRWKSTPSPTRTSITTAARCT